MTQEAQQVVTPLAALKLALEALKKCHYYMIDAGLPNQSLLNEAFTAYKALEAFKEHSMQEVQRLGQEIEHEPVGDEWTPCIKLPVIVHVRKQRHGETHVSTREGITPVNLEDLIMRGVSGEEYPIGRAIFEQTYSLDTTPPQRTWVDLTDTQIEQAYFEVVQEHRGAPMPWGQVQFGRALLDKFKEVNT